MYLWYNIGNWFDNFVVFYVGKFGMMGGIWDVIFVGSSCDWFFWV